VPLRIESRLDSIELANFPPTPTSPSPHVPAVHKASLLPFVFVMYATRRRAIWPRGYGDDERPGLTCSITCSFLYSGAFPCRWWRGLTRRSREADSTAGCARRLGTSGDFRPGGELERFVPAGRSYGVLDRGLSHDHFRSTSRFPLDHYVIAVAVIVLIGYHQRARHPDGCRVATILEISILVPLVALCVVAGTKWHHNPFSPRCAACSAVPVFGVGLALGLWLLFRLRASVQRGGRSGKSATQLSNRTSGGIPSPLPLTFADDVFAGGAGPTGRSGTPAIFFAMRRNSLADPGWALRWPLPQWLPIFRC